MAFSDDKTFHAQYDTSQPGLWVSMAAKAILALKPAVISSDGGWDAWFPLSVPGQLVSTLTSHAGHGFIAKTRYGSDQPGWILLAVIEEYVTGAPPFQQTFIGFVDCQADPPMRINPLELLELEFRRGYERPRMWSTAVAEQVVATTFQTIEQAWVARWAGHPPTRLESQS